MGALKTIVAVLFFMLGQAVGSRLLQLTPAAINISCLLVFGDSTVDPGNNNNLNTTMKANFPPYGVDFSGGRPTGRHSNGNLPGDLIVQMIGTSNTLPAFLNHQNLTNSQLRSGVSFASAGAGLDETTDASQNVLPFSKQIKLLEQYKDLLSSINGSAEAQNTVENALVFISAGTYDFVANYLVVPGRSNEFTEEEYIDYLILQLSKNIEEIHSIGPKKFVLMELGPMGCLPIMRTRFGGGYCHPPINNIALSFNSKQAAAATQLKKKLNITITINRAYEVMNYAITTPGKFGFTIAELGCCGNGTVDYGLACKDKKLCSDPKKYLFFDAVNPSENMYAYFARNLIADLEKEAMGN